MIRHQAQEDWKVVSPFFRVSEALTHTWSKIAMPHLPI